MDEKSKGYYMANGLRAPAISKVAEAIRVLQSMKEDMVGTHIGKDQFKSARESINEAEECYNIFSAELEAWEKKYNS